MDKQRHTDDVQLRKFLEHCGYLIVPVTVIFGAGINSGIQTHPVRAGYLSFGILCLGALSLFVARLPLYRQRRFFTVGPSSLPKPSLKWYRLAYLLILLGLVVLMAAVLRL